MSKSRGRGVSGRTHTQAQINNYANQQASLYFLLIHILCCFVTRKIEFFHNFFNNSFT